MLSSRAPDARRRALELYRTSAVDDEAIGIEESSEEEWSRNNIKKAAQS